MTAESPQSCAAEFTAALIGRRIDLAVNLLTDDVVFFYSNGTTIVSKDAFAATMTASWNLITDYKYQHGDSNWIAQSDDAAALIYSLAWSGLVRGAEVSGAGRGTRIFSRPPGSGWLLAHEHLSNGAWKP